jgi:hypothetical protein
LRLVADFDEAALFTNHSRMHNLPLTRLHYCHAS